VYRRLLITLLALTAGFAPAAGQAQDVIRGPVIPLDQSSVQLVVDSRQPLGQVGAGEAGPSYRLRGWAVDLRALDGPGIRQIIAYLDGPSNRGRLLGWARYGLPRPDVGTVFNDPSLARSGFELSWPVADLPLQTEPVHAYTLYVYLDTATGWVAATLPVTLALAADGTPEN